jgi:hypothetical protein
MTNIAQHKKRGSKCLSPKMVPLREEFISLTNDPLIAIVLNQLLYWTQRVKDFDLLLEEERFFNPECNVSPRHGWIYKTSKELIIETMIRVDRTTMRRYLKTLIDKGWLEERSNPNNRWDKTSQYRLNLRKLQEDLWKIGFNLPGIHLLTRKEFKPKEKRQDSNSEFSETEEYPNVHYAPSNGAHSEEQISPSNDFNFQESPSEELIAPREEHFAPSERLNSPLYIQRLHTENINRDYQQRTRAREKFSDFENSENSTSENSASDEPILEKSILNVSVTDESVAAEMVKHWEHQVVRHFPAESENKRFDLTEERKDQLESLFAFHFQNDMRLWERFCLRVKASNFLMGGGANGWTVSLDWTLRKGSLSKILEGHYDNAKKSGQQESSEWKLEKIQPPALTAEKEAILDAIKDPVWKKWCTKLATGIPLNDFKMLHEPLSAVQLSQITNARFLECEDERLIWIGSSDPGVLNALENLRLQISWVFAKEYPKARSIRTRLDSATFPLNTHHTLKGENSHD